LGRTVIRSQDVCVPPVLAKACHKAKRRVGVSRCNTLGRCERPAAVLPEGMMAKESRSAQLAGAVCRRAKASAAGGRRPGRTRKGRAKQGARPDRALR
jgi:hypothetical protein